MLTRLALHLWQPPRDFAGRAGRFRLEDMVSTEDQDYSA